MYLAIDNFLVTDIRFFLPGPPEPGEQSETFQINGVRNVTEEQIVQVFGRDFGRSVFLCPLKERRLKLLGIDWVKEASIGRLWPNRLVIRITERKPEAFVQMQAADGTMLLSLIDAEGVLLDPQRARSFRLPVLTGVARAKGDAGRRERMKRFLRMQSELGSYMDKISEIDVGLQTTQNHSAVRQAGIDTDARQPEIIVSAMRTSSITTRRFEGACRTRSCLDLRLKDRITAVAAVASQLQSWQGAVKSGAK